MTLVYTPVAPLEYVKARLRSYIHPKEIDDDELLRLATEAYQRLCEESLALQQIIGIPDTADQAESALPADHYRTIRVYRNGLRQQRLPDLLALSGKESGYYEYDGYLGVSPTPSSSNGQTWLLYARTPAGPASWTASLDEDFPAEFTYALVHYVHARVSTAVGGEGRLSQVAWHRQQFEQAVTQMRRRVMTPNTSEIKRATSPRTNGHPRAQRTVSSGEGALVIIGAPPSGGGGGSGPPAGDFVTQAEFDALPLDRAAYLGIAGAVPTGTDIADFPFIMPFSSTLRRIKATLKTAATTAMTIQLRRSQGPDVTVYQDVPGVSVTFPIGSRGVIYDSVDLNVAENDVLNFSVTQGSGVNLSFVVVFDPIGASAAPGPVVAGGVLAGTYPNPSFAQDMATRAEVQAAFVYNSVIPTTGTHLLAEVVWNSAPEAGGNVGWVCTVPGTPGTWKPFGAIGV
jgi:hypothetical protein